MYDKKERVKSILEDAVGEMELLIKMSEDIRQPDDFITSMSGLVLFRACSMSLQYITEGFVKIRNLCSIAFFALIKPFPGNLYLECAISCPTNMGTSMPKVFSIR